MAKKATRRTKRRRSHGMEVTFDNAGLEMPSLKPGFLEKAMKGAAKKVADRILKGSWDEPFSVLGSLAVGDVISLGDQRVNITARIESVTPVVATESKSNTWHYRKQRTKKPRLAPQGARG